jgi:hypothetical protein
MYFAVINTVPGVCTSGRYANVAPLDFEIADGADAMLCDAVGMVLKRFFFNF